MRRRLLGVPTVRFSKGQLFFNSEAMRNHFKDKEFLELSWDSENLKVGVLPLRKESSESFPIKRYREDSPVGTVFVSSLFKEIKEVLESKNIKTFPLRKEGNLLVIDLKD